jgi:hypothetical protein
MTVDERIKDACWSKKGGNENKTEIALRAVVITHEMSRLVKARLIGKVRWHDLASIKALRFRTAQAKL